ncbi:MAG: PAS domain S-box protein [Planctomycetota bacterium]
MKRRNEKTQKAGSHGQQTKEVQDHTLEESRPSGEETTALLEGARAVLEYREFKDAAQSIFDSCKKLIGVPAGYIALLSKDGSENEVVYLDAGGASCTVDPDLPMPIRGLREEAQRTGKAVYDNNFADSKWMKYIPQGHAELENAMFAPLIIKDKVVGLLGLANKPGGFTDNDTRLASAFGEFASMALQNSRTLESLEDSEKRFRSVAETANDAIITINSQGNIVYWNKAAEIIFGYLAADIIGSPLTRIMPERYREAHRQGLERVVSTGSAKIIGQTLELAGCTKDGTEFPIELSIASWKSGEEQFFTGIVRDITNRKRAEEAVERMAAFLRENPEPVIALDSKGKVIHSNPGVHTLLASLEGPKEDISVILPHRVSDIVAGCLRTGAGRRMVEVNVGGKVLSWSFHPLASEDVVHAYGRDITDRKKAEEALLQEKQKLDYVTDSSNCGLLLLDDQVRIIYANKISEVWFGSFDQIKGKPCYKLFQLEEKECAGLQVLRRGETVRSEAFAKTVKGEERFFYTVASPIKNADGKVIQVTEVIIDVTDRKQAEMEREKLLYDMGERVKELRCLYGVADLIHRRTTLEAVFRDVVVLIPSGWQYPQIARGRIRFGGKVYVSEPFEETEWKQTSDIIVGGKRCGSVEVFYMEKRPQSIEGPFLKEERYLIDGLAKTLSEVIERKRAEEALDRLAAFPRENPEPVVALDPDGKIIYSNPGAKAFVAGRCGPEADISAILPSNISTIAAECIRTGINRHMVEVTVGARTLSWSIHPLESGEGVHAYGRDITDRKRAEEALHQSREDLNHAQAVAHTGSWRLDVQRNELLWSDENHRIFGIPKGTPMTYETFLATVHLDDREFVDRSWQAGLRGEHYDIEHRIVVNDEVKWVRERAVLEFDKQGKLLGGFGTTQDVTERKRAAEALQQAHDELEIRVRERTAELSKINEMLRNEIAERKRAVEQAARHQAELAHVSRLSTMGEMTSAIAHEINQPLCAILSYAQGCMRLMKSGGKDSDGITEALKQVVAQSKRAGKIVNHLRDYGRKREPHKSTIDINHIVQESVNFVANEIRAKDISIRLKLADWVPLVMGDTIEIEQVIINLVRNGIEAMDEIKNKDGELIIETAPAGDDAVEIAVSDKGRGFPLGSEDKIFEPFYSTKQEGLGIGLSISRSIIEAHGGRLWATSNTDGGATFRFTLPMADNTE